MINYYLPDGSKISHNDFIASRGECYACGTPKDLTVHHCLFDDISKRGRKIKELQDVRNLMVLCRRCHVDKRLFKGYPVREAYWWKQCERYGQDKMIEWVISVPLLTRERYELLEE